jgi:hypothetical protein
MNYWNKNIGNLGEKKLYLWNNNPIFAYLFDTNLNEFWFVYEKIKKN